MISSAPLKAICSGGGKPPQEVQVVSRAAAMQLVLGCMRRSKEHPRTFLPLRVFLSPFQQSCCHAARCWGLFCQLAALAIKGTLGALNVKRGSPRIKGRVLLGLDPGGAQGSGGGGVCVYLRGIPFFTGVTPPPMKSPGTSREVGFAVPGNPLSEQRGECKAEQGRRRQGWGAVGRAEGRQKGQEGRDAPPPHLMAPSAPLQPWHRTP